MRNSNIIPKLHRFVTDELGENYWLHGCCRYVMGALNEPDFDYEFFAGTSGDIFTQVFAFDRFRGDCASDFLLSAGHWELLPELFAMCGYSAEFVPEERVLAQSELYLQRIMEHIDRGVPVMSNLVISGIGRWLVFVGYEMGGETLLFMTDNMTEPESVPSKEIFAGGNNDGWSRGLVFVGEKKEQVELADVYRRAIGRLPELMRTRTQEFCFGPGAFRAWADEIERGRYEDIDPQVFEREKWYLYTNYVCILATNGSCCHEFLNRAMWLAPDMAWLSELDRLYERMANLWEKDPEGLEAIGGGFDVTWEALRDRERRGRIAGKLREFAGLSDSVLETLDLHYQNML